MEIRGTKALLIILLNIGLLLSAVYTSAGVDPGGDITINPTNPAPKSDVTFSVDINVDSISMVRLIIRECNKETGICHMPQNISMNKVDDDSYEGEVKLEHDDVNAITYQIVVKNNGKWTEYDEYSTSLSIKSDNTNNNENESNGSPGFEIFSFLIAIVGFILFKRFKKNK